MISFINDTNFMNNIKHYLDEEYNYDFTLWIGFQTVEGKSNTYINLLSRNCYTISNFKMSWI